jgi:hypothetical protein
MEGVRASVLFLQIGIRAKCIINSNIAVLSVTEILFSYGFFFQQSNGGL